MKFWRRRQVVGDRQQLAEATIQRARQEVRHFRHYLELVVETALMLRRYGLGQTLAYLQMRSSGRPDSPYAFIYQHLQEHLRRSPGFRGKDALAFLTQEDSTTYLRLAREALAFSELWVRAARAAQKEMQRGSRATPTTVQHQGEGVS
jgi:hypothetical protein